MIYYKSVFIDDFKSNSDNDRYLLIGWRRSF